LVARLRIDVLPWADVFRLFCILWACIRTLHALFSRVSVAPRACCGCVILGHQSRLHSFLLSEDVDKILFCTYDPLLSIIDPPLSIIVEVLAVCSSFHNRFQGWAVVLLRCHLWALFWLCGPDLLCRFFLWTIHFSWQCIKVLRSRLMIFLCLSVGLLCTMLFRDHQP